MRHSQQSLVSPDAAWWLADGQVQPLRTGPGPRRLQVLQGRLWLTVEGPAGEPARDVWLAPGEGIDLPAGARLLLEGWPRARFELLVPPPSARRAGGAARRGLGGVFSRLVSAVRAAWRPAAPGPHPVG